MKELLGHINSFQPLDDCTEKAILHFFTEEIYLKNEFLAEEGKVCSKINFIKSGLVRRYYVNDGEEITRWLYHDNH